jgi:hypothetical protein
MSAYPGGAETLDQWFAYKASQEQHGRRSRAAKAGWGTRRRRGYVARGRSAPHERYREHALALAYRVQQISRQEFARRFAELRRSQGVLVSERAEETRWLEYVGCLALYRAKGQDFKTTNGQRAQGLCARGRPRCSRTVQRAHKDLAAMGLLGRAHVRRAGAQAGRRDCLRVRLLPSYVTPPSAAGVRGLRPSLTPAPTADCAGFAGREREDRAPPGQIAPPNGGRHRRAPAAPAPNGSDEEVKRLALGGYAPLPESVPRGLDAIEAALREGFPGGLSSQRGDVERR